MKQQQHKKIIISGGGTGGHVFPAIAIANALKKKDPATEILFVGAKGKMEMEKVPAAGYEIVGLPVIGFRRKLSVQNITFFFYLMSSLVKAKKIIRKFTPDVVVGVGGFASGPVLHIASRRGIPCLIQEQNSYPGVTNKLLAKRAHKICVAYDDMEKYFQKEKIIKTGNPVRQDLLDIAEKKSEAYNYFGLQGNKKTLLVIGGSLGARTINESVITRIQNITDEKIQLVWQTGKIYYGKAKEEAAKYDPQLVKVYDFISRMDYAFAIADVVISRAGASTISELCIVHKPAILVPSPNVAEDHQTKNAMALVKNDAAMMITDMEARKSLIDNALELIDDEYRQKVYSEKIAKMAVKDSADIIAEEIMKMSE